VAVCNFCGRRDIDIIYVTDDHQNYCLDCGVIRCKELENEKARNHAGHDIHPNDDRDGVSYSTAREPHETAF